jgi:hypothetical protein
VSGLTVAGLWRMCAAASDERRVLIVTGPDGGRWAAWPYGCIALPAALDQRLGGPVGGGYRLRRGGRLEPFAWPGLSADLVAGKMLPLLAATDRTAISPSPWMRESLGRVHRILERSDNCRTLVDEQLWQAWRQDLPVWQVGDRMGPIVWAAEGEPGQALLMPTWARPVPVPPAVADV